MNIRARRRLSQAVRKILKAARDLIAAEEALLRHIETKGDDGAKTRKKSPR